MMLQTPDLRYFQNGVDTQGRTAEAEIYLHRAEQRHRALREGARERDGINASDLFEHHGLAGDLVDYLTERVTEVRDIEEAYLVRKCTRHLADRPVIVLGVQPRKLSIWARWHHEAIEALLQDKIRRFPHELQLVRFDRCEPAVAAGIRAVPNSRICPARTGSRRRR
jgi:hypothetical protein